MREAQKKAVPCLTMPLIAAAGTNDGEQEYEQDHIVVSLLTMMTIFVIEFFTLWTLATMCRATAENTELTPTTGN